MVSVSVILPTYNRAVTLERAIDSVLNQEFQDLELIIVDDGSTDNTREVVSKYLNNTKVKYLYQKNSGASIARNRGVEEAKAELIGFQDSDDEWLPDKLSEQVRVFQQSDESLSMVYSDVTRIEVNGSISHNKVPEIKSGDLFNEQTLEYQVFGIGLQTCLIRKKYLKKVGGFDDKLPRFIDLDVFIKLSKISKLYRINTELVKYYATDGISTNTKNAAVARERLLDRYKGEVVQFPASLANQYLQIAGSYWKSQEKILFKKYAYQVLKVSKAKLTTKFKAIILLIIPRWIGKIILGR